MDLAGFIEYFKRFGAEMYNRYYGPYKAVVTTNADPENRGRIQVVCERARLLKDNNMWLLPMESSGLNNGQFWPPARDSGVWIYFDNGDPRRPLCYQGGWWTPDAGVHEALKPLGEPVRRGWTTPGGAVITLDDTKDAETITIEQKNGKMIKISPTKVSIGTKEGDYEQMFKAETVKQWLESHTHPHSWGPTGSPIQPFPAKGLSDDTENS
jgi:hypothetical protein